MKKIQIQVVDILLKKKECFLSEIIGETGLEITSVEGSGEKIKPENLSKLEKVFFVLDFLEKNDFIKIDQQSTAFAVKKDGSQVSCWDIYPDIFEEKIEEDAKIFVNKFNFFENLFKNRFNRKIKIDLSLWKYKKNGYKTDEQKREFLNFWTAILAALLAAIGTAIATNIFDCFPCFLNF